MAAGTTVSRLSGFGRVLAVGWVLGQGRLADAYNQANTVPNTIYELLLGGVLSATLLPVLMEALSRKGDDRDAVSYTHLDTHHVHRVRRQGCQYAAAP